MNAGSGETPGRERGEVLVCPRCLGFRSLSLRTEADSEYYVYLKLLESRYQES